MNTCDRYKEKLSALLDGELKDTERDEVLAHLETCADCQAYFAELNEIHNAFGDMEPIDVPEGFAAGVMARLHEEAPSKAAKKRAPWRKWTTLAACAAVVVLAVVAVPNMFRMGGAAKSAGADSVAPASAESVEAPESYIMSTVSTEEADGDATAQTTDEAAMGSELYAVQTNDNLTAALQEKETADEPGEADNGAAADTERASDQTNEGSAPMTMMPAEQRFSGVLTLSGEGAEDWLKEHGAAWDEANACYLVSVEAIEELPDSLMLEGAVAPVNDLLPVVVAETEAAP